MKIKVEITAHVTHTHVHSDTARLESKLDGLIASFQQFKENTMTVQEDIAALIASQTAEIAENTDLVASVKAALALNTSVIAALRTQLEEAGILTPELRQILSDGITKLDSNNAELAVAVLASTGG